MPSWQEFQPFLVIGLALGGVYALSGVGMVVLFRATGVLNLAFGAIGAMGALIAWQAINSWGLPQGIAWLICVLFAALLSTAYGLIFGTALAKRDPVVKATATLGLALFMLGSVNVTWTQVISVGLGVVLTGATAVFLRATKLGTAMRAMANDREIT